jgi:hypothetical protein
MRTTAYGLRLTRLRSLLMCAMLAVVAGCGGSRDAANTPTHPSGAIAELTATRAVTPSPTTAAEPTSSPAPPTATRAATATTEATPADEAASYTAISESGMYRVTLTPQIDPLVINTLHRWILHVETIDGDPLDGATMGIDGDMPAHGHGLPTQPRVTQALGNGDYLVEGMKFQMPGEWVLDVTIEVGGQTDSAHVDFTIV